MDNLEPFPGFYDDNEYGEYEKHLLHHAAVSVLNIYLHNIQVLHFSIFFNKNTNNIFD